jgi:hypothetical protein
MARSHPLASFMDNLELAQALAPIAVIGGVGADLPAVHGRQGLE